MTNSSARADVPSCARKTVMNGVGAEAKIALNATRSCLPLPRASPTPTLCRALQQRSPRA